MRDYTKISTSIWNSRKFTKLSSMGKLLYLYFLTCPNVNSIGCFVIKEGYVKADLDWNGKEYEKTLKELSDRELVRTFAEENLVRIINFLDFEQFSNPKHAAGALKIALNLPDCVEKHHLFQNIKATADFLKKASNYDEFDRVSDSLSKQYRNTETETEPETDTEPPTDVGAGADASPAKKKKRKTAWRDGWRPNPLSQHMNDKLQLSQEELKHEFQKFEQNCKAHNRQYVDWDAAWRNWLQSDYGTYGRRIAGQSGQGVGGSSSSRNGPQASGYGGSFQRELDKGKSQSAVESYIDVTPSPDDADGTLRLVFDEDP